MMTLEQIGLLAILWYEAEGDWSERVHAKPCRPTLRSSRLMTRRQRTLRAAIHAYKLLEEVKKK